MVRWGPAKEGEARTRLVLIPVELARSNVCVNSYYEQQYGGAFVGERGKKMKKKVGLEAWVGGMLIRGTTRGAAEEY